jgi:conjugal transfer pilus assembly protein TraU
MMKSIRLLICCFLAFLAPSHASAQTCPGKFPNPLTDICWSCVFPIRIFSATVASMGQEDTLTRSGRNLCTCLDRGGSTVFGVPVEFWEQARMVEVVNEPYCYPMLGGMQLDISFRGLIGGTTADKTVGSTHDQGQIRSGQRAFRNINYYVSPFMFIMQVVMDNDCMEKVNFDLAYTSNLDPMWDDPELAGILTPYMYAFADTAALNACAVDCGAAAIGFPLSSLFWCAGCNGSTYPLTGDNTAHLSAEQTGRLLTQRLLAKMHASGMVWATHGDDAMCRVGYPMMMMDKGAYKVSRAYYIPQKKLTGRCCDPLGRMTDLAEIGAEIPVYGKDIGYSIFRKRHCCQGVVDLQ